MHVSFSKSVAYESRYPEVGFGLVLVTGCGNPENPEGFDQYKRKLLRRMRKRETLAQVTERIGVYDRFFQESGHNCPLPGHLKRTVNSGFPRYDLLVDAHFMAEMCAGILVAVTDFDRFEGPLTLDLADEGEVCLGMGGREMRTRQGEIVLRDEAEIVCVLCQGADEKTRVTADTKNVLYYAYGVPGVESEHLKNGLHVAEDAVIRFGGGTSRGIKVF
ncbi:MAG: phenylalanine--tRNA ligase beta subunit-related protein [Thermodesulfobacteriota bacterium]